ncbi:large conductance mechanosensitive channel protein MscL [Demequina salsinemoris]|uniref:large conductance mechanosensitive channel protein MscL n=1 Tax=Demequina salsinemoris TaxID=577470 RepID=UPI000B170AF9|nr:large conductance mechanosensitive channel protein MscL [Demequina salsinemoris]
MIKGFKDFLMRGNVVDLAVAVVIGTAFTAVVNAIVAGIITPLVAMIFGQPDLTAVATFTINNAEFSIGLVLDALFKFVTIAAAVYFVIVMPLNKLAEMRKKDEPAEEPAGPTEIELLTEIRDALAKKD